MKTYLIPILLVFLSAAVIWRLVARPDPAQTFNLEINNYVLGTFGVMKLQVVEEVTLEKIERREKDSTFWNMIALPDIVVQVQVPVTTSYFVDLEKGMTLEERGGAWQLTVPDLEFNAPAADISALEFQVKQGQFFQRTEGVKQSLQKMLTPLMNDRARAAIPRLRPLAEQKLKDFLIQWFAAQKLETPQAIEIFWTETPQPIR